jgi:hypothetical protein
MTASLRFLTFSADGSGNILGSHRYERSMSDRLLGTPECLPIFLPDLQRSKDIDRKTSRYLSLSFVPHDLFVQNKRHGF